jgi:hypothetical protein
MFKGSLTMSPQERQVLQDFLNQLVQVRGIVKDPEADAMIARAVAQQPDAPYLLVQRALLLEQALKNAQEEIAALQNQLRGSRQASPSFLDANAWGNSGAVRPAPVAQPAPAAMPQYQMSPQAMAPGGGPGFMRGGMGGMGGLLGNVAATAAGVAGGAFLYHGIENMLGHHGGNDQGSNGLLGQQNEASAQNAFPSLTRPEENNAASNNLASNPSQDESGHTGGDTSSGLVDDAGSNFLDDSGGDDSLFT